jgi:hypothetical protein
MGRYWREECGERRDNEERRREVLNRKFGGQG